MSLAQIEAKALSRLGPTPPEKVVSGPTGLRWQWQLVVACAAILLIFSRQPDALLHAQFFAEDGKVWFADAYNIGWFAALFRPQDGYFQTFPRLAAALSLLVPMAWAPLAMNLAGLLIQVLPVPLLLSSRCAAWGSLPLRAMLAFTYLAMPNSFDMNLTVTESQWRLALIACLLLLGSAPTNRAWKLFDIAIFVLCGLTGPFAILLLPIAALRLWLRREHSAVWPLLILCFAAAVQMFALLTSPRLHSPLGASVQGLLRLAAGQVFLGAILGSNDFAAHNLLPFLLCVTIAGALLVAYCFLKAGYEWKVFLLFSAVVFAASLANPATPRLPRDWTAWRLLAAAPGIRYWFFPTLAFTWTIVWYLFERPRRPVCHRIGFVLIALMLTGLIRDWRIPPWKDMQFASYVEKFNACTPGTVLIIPVHPDGWTMRLVKR